MSRRCRWLIRRYRKYWERESKKAQRFWVLDFRLEEEEKNLPQIDADFHRLEERTEDRGFGHT